MANPYDVAVLVPTYNRASLLRDTLDSIFAQTYPHFEVVVSNNHSTDNTASVLEEYASKYLNLRVVSPPSGTNGPQNHAFLLDQVTCPYFTFLGDDDLWEPQFLATMKQVIEVENADAAASGWWVWIPEQGSKEPYIGADRGVLADPEQAIYNSRPLHVGAMLMRSEAVKEVGGMNRTWQNIDYDLYIRMARQGKRFVFVPEPLMHYRMHPGAHCARIAEVSGDYARIMEAYPSTNPATDKMRRLRIADNYTSMGRALTDDGKPQEARGAFQRALSATPRHKRAWAGLLLTFLPQQVVAGAVNVKRRLTDSAADAARRQSAV